MDIEDLLERLESGEDRLRISESLREILELARRIEWEMEQNCDCPICRPPVDYFDLSLAARKS